jgi:periplasmic divalent cation tolerance protein
MTEALVLLCSVDGAEAAERIGRELVERRLAACVSVVPGAISIYRWRGAVERAEERLLLIKTAASRFEELRAALVSLHPYQVPELIALPVAAGHQPYLDWLRESVG